ncbi:GGDEF domain-containing protein [Kineococcus rubinsiae]|uniref:GGDEF domain-containing protein n=1 Tax=Kineococcus rubinsiae TaxID=2609562 RepID=UPI00142FD538|nr:GGDEF domain-containing protein [Kineococcus rubinsiae]NIZ89987.1 GGDEF domain-containing protein [Kineococcus rubinsiae]
MTTPPALRAAPAPAPGGADHLAVRGSPANRRWDGRATVLMAAPGSLVLLGLAPFVPAHGLMLLAALGAAVVAVWAHLTPVGAPAWVRAGYSAFAAAVLVAGTAAAESLPSLDIGSIALLSPVLVIAMTRSRREIVLQLAWQQLVWGGYLLSTGPAQRAVVGVVVSASVLGLVAGCTSWLRGLVETALRELTDSAGRDPLTGLLNRRGLAAAPAATPSCWLLLLDLDHFKRINDEHGHAVGDETLVWFADLLSAGTRPGEVAARIGGEEFVLRLPAGVDAAARAEELRAAVASPSQDRPVPVTVSIGVAGGGWAQLPEVLAAADAALYAAKRAGRDRVVLAPADAGAADTADVTVAATPGERRTHRARP